MLNRFLYRGSFIVIVAGLSILSSGVPAAVKPVGPPAPAPTPEIQACWDACDDVHDQLINDAVDDYWDRMDEIFMDYSDAVDAAEQDYRDTVAGCLDFWCISDALDAYNDAVDNAEAQRNADEQEAGDDLLDQKDEINEDREACKAGCGAMA